VLQAGVATVAAAITVTDRASGATATIDMQLDWLAGGNQSGEIAAVHLGYFAEEGVRAFREKRAPVWTGR